MATRVGEKAAVRLGDGSYLMETGGVLFKIRQDADVLRDDENRWFVEAYSRRMLDAVGANRAVPFSVSFPTSWATKQEAIEAARYAIHHRKKYGLSKERAAAVDRRYLTDDGWEISENMNRYHSGKDLEYYRMVGRMDVRRSPARAYVDEILSIAQKAGLSDDQARRAMQFPYVAQGKSAAQARIGKLFIQAENEFLHNDVLTEFEKRVRLLAKPRKRKNPMTAAERKHCAHERSEERAFASLLSKLPVGETVTLSGRRVRKLSKGYVVVDGIRLSDKQAAAKIHRGN